MNHLQNSGKGFFAVEIVTVQEFTSPVSVMPGDKIHVTHTYMNVDEVCHEEKCSYEIQEVARWTCHIGFRLNGHLNFILGNEDTLAWLEGQE